VDKGNQDASGSKSQARDIAEIKAGLGELSKTVQGLVKQLGPRPATYSQVLGQATNDTATRAARAARATKAIRSPIFLALENTKRTKPVPPVHARQLIVNPGNESESQRNRTGEELVNDINIALGIKDVIRACRLLSGSALITLLGAEEKTKWETQTGILKAFGEGAKIQTREYTVLALDVQTAAIDSTNQERAIAKIYEQNPRLKESVKIVRVGQPKKALLRQWECTNLYIGVVDPGQANIIIEQGLYLGNRWYKYEVFNRDC
jgi:uncharacterized protein YggE